MGATNSTSNNIQTVLEEETNNIVTEVLTKNSTSVNVSQNIDLSCDIGELCLKENEYYAEKNARVMERGFPNPNLGPRPGTSVCDLCSAVGINQSATISISTETAVTDKIANDIKAEMITKLQKEIETKSAGALLSDNSTELTNLSDIKKSVENNFNTTIVRDTILQYSYAQNIKLKNVRAANINQTIIATGISRNIISNLMETDKSFKSAIDSLDKIKSKETNAVGIVGETISDVAGTIGKTVSSAVDSIASAFGGIWIFILIIGAFIFIMFKDILLCLPPLSLFTSLCKNNQPSPSGQLQLQPSPSGQVL
jgi:hypothetical protein